MPDLLLELFSEEIPAQIQRKAANDLKKGLTNQLIKNHLNYDTAQEYWTPRRLTINIHGLSSQAQNIYTERKGPSINAGKTAIDGFIRSAQLKSISEAKIVTDKKGDYYVIQVIKHGRRAQNILAEILPEIIYTFPWEKSMRWEKYSNKIGSLRWIRPLRSILCLFISSAGSEIIDFQVGSIRSSNLTYGHRFMSTTEPIRVQNFSDYIKKLQQNRVILDHNKRKKIILSEAHKLCSFHNIKLLEDNDLTDEIADLVEWPTVLIGTFEEKFLEIPKEIIRLTIRKNQKCFVTYQTDQKSSLSNHFILVANIQAKDAGKTIIAGNAKVIQARLSDALYFWKIDQRLLPPSEHLSSSAKNFNLNLQKPLDQRMARLDSLQVMFHTQLGTQGERVSRIAALGITIAPLIQANKKVVHRAAILAKADLQTEIVREFPQLQGFIGGKYAILQGETMNVALSIEEHYKPQGLTDNIPQEPSGIALSLADKIDMLTGFWLINEKPTGSRDPYALRRAALGVIRLILTLKKNIPLMPLFRKATNLLTPHMKRAADHNQSSTCTIQYSSDILQDLLAFFHERLKKHLQGEGISHDLINAILEPQKDNIFQIASQVQVLNTYLKTENGKQILTIAKRIMNILKLDNVAMKKQSIKDIIDPLQLLEQEEIALYQSLLKIEAKSHHLRQEGNLLEILSALSSLIKPVNCFFEKVLINHANIQIRSNRLAILKRTYQITTNIVDFSKIKG